MVLLASMQTSHFEISIRMMIFFISYLEIWYYSIHTGYFISKYGSRRASFSCASKNAI